MGIPWRNGGSALWAWPGISGSSDGLSVSVSDSWTVAYRRNTDKGIGDKSGGILRLGIMVLLCRSDPRLVMLSKSGCG